MNLEFVKGSQLPTRDTADNGDYIFVISGGVTYKMLRSVFLAGISGGSQNLQEVLAVGKYANVDINFDVAGEGAAINFTDGDPADGGQVIGRIEGGASTFVYIDKNTDQFFHIQRPSVGNSQLIAPQNLVPETIATREWTDNLIEGLKTKQPVRVATTANITLSGTQTIDGVALSVDDRVLVKDQTTETANGIYLVKSSTWERTADGNTATELTNAVVSVLEGSANGQSTFRQTATSITLGSTNIVWQSFGSSVADATPTTKGKAKLYTDLGVNEDGSVTQKVVKEGLDGKQNVLTFDAEPTPSSTNPVESGGVYTAIENAVASAEITDTGALINNAKIIQQGQNYRFNDFSTYTKTNAGTVLSAGLNASVVTYECIDTGKIITKDTYCITLTGTCGTTNTSAFGFGLKDGANYHSILYRGSTGFVQGFQYDVNSVISAANGGDYAITASGIEPLYNVGDVVSVRVFFEQNNVCWQTAVNGVWTRVRKAHPNAFRYLGELVINIRTTSNWTNIYANIQTKAEYNEVCYISPTGVDTNSGTKLSPLRTVNEAVFRTKGVGRIIALEGDYLDENINFCRNINLEAEDGARVRFIYGERITSASFTSGSTKVYEITHAAISGTTLQLANVPFWQHDVIDPLSEILANESHPFHNGRTHRLPSLKCTYLSGGIPALEASDSSRSYWFQSGGKIFFTIKSGTNLATNPLVIPSLGAATTPGFNFTIADGVKGVKVGFKNIEILYAPVSFEFTKPTIEDCVFGFSRAEHQVQYGYTIAALFRRCEAFGCNYFTGTTGDGFNNHSDIGVSGSSRHFATSYFEDCYAHDNMDDGISWHQYCECNGTRFLSEYNGSGITPASGGHGVFTDSICRKNTLAGFSIVSAGSLDGLPYTNFHLINCLSENNGTNFLNPADANAKFTVMNCVARGTGTHYSGTFDKINSIP